MMGGNFR
jgi:hypothetical protein